MSKSADSPQGAIALLDDPKAITKRIKAAVTDSETEVRFDPEAKPGVSNLLQILAAATGRSIPEVAAEHSGGGYGGLKTATAEAVVELLAPLQARYTDLAADPGAVDDLLGEGAAKAEAIADGVMLRVREAVGLLPRRS
jgi:tryptophanyl-tRNA synthetase